MGPRPSPPVLALCAALSLLAACGGGVPVLMYHSISEDGGALTIAPAVFDQHLAYLAKAGFTTVSLAQVVDEQEGRGSLPAYPIVLTFDDGYLDAVKTVLPLLQKRGQTGTFFVVSGFTGADASHRYSDGKQEHVVESEVRQLAAAGMEIGSHTVKHLRLTGLKPAELRVELDQSKSDLEKVLGSRVDFFSYPFTAQRSDIRAAVQRAGYRGAVAGPHGNGDPYDLQRITIHRGMTAQDLRGLLAESWATGYSTGSN